MKTHPTFWNSMAHLVQRALQEMEALEAGSIANQDEKRMVGHYWLRSPTLAPNPQLREEIISTQTKIDGFARQVLDGSIHPPTSQQFKRLLLIGIGGSALGPQLIADALANSPGVGLQISFLDNTDPDGIARVLASLKGRLKSTLSLIISKSGTTQETYNGMVAAMEAYQAEGLNFSQHAVAITGNGSVLDQLAKKDQWLETFPLWDWVGGRTSITSAVGLLPAALLNCDIAKFLEGAALCDVQTRKKEVEQNPALLLALAWHELTKGAGNKAMVVLPYKDQLALFPKYLQQLIMESLGKAFNQTGNLVEQGLTVYGNKGTTDQHATLQQLREGLNNSFVTFIQVLKNQTDYKIAPDTTAGDYLNAFLLGTRHALSENHRPSLTITLDHLDSFTLGVLIALFERAVGFYATFIQVNAYNQPGVEVGKKAAKEIIALQKEVIACMKNFPQCLTAEEIATRLGKKEKTELIREILKYLGANNRALLSKQ